MWEWWHPGGAPNRECQPGVPNLPAHIGNTTTQQIITQHILIFLAVQTFFVVIFLSGANTGCVLLTFISAGWVILLLLFLLFIIYFFISAGSFWFFYSLFIIYYLFWWLEPAFGPVLLFWFGNLFQMDNFYSSNIYFSCLDHFGDWNQSSILFCCRSTISWSWSEAN